MFAQTRRTIAIGLLAGYLLMVTAAPQVHRCYWAHVRPSPACGGEACGHCQTDCGEARTQAREVGIESIPAVVADAVAEHDEARCLICQMLAQKHMADDGLRLLYRVEVVREAPVGEPRAAAGTLPRPWHIRAPPAVA
ncbi:MAG: hypothetical protein GX575_00920 [Candidatus Anammoximicrobium sp.]|nr:hypothetical protein [Candidatus Anammoximicrobium sp.]